MIIDSHTHFIPEVLIREIRRGNGIDNIRIAHNEGKEWIVHPQGFSYVLAREFWDMDFKLRQMDSLGIDASLLSLSPTMLLYWLEASAGIEFSQLANNALAKLVAQSDRRLFGIATLPMQDPIAAQAELVRSTRDLGLLGAMIGTAVEGVPLDDGRFAGLFETAEQLGVSLVLHPYYVGPSHEFADYYMTNLIGNPLDTCVAAARLILSGTLDRHASLRFVLVHGGGFLPYQIGRIDHGFRVRAEVHREIATLPSSYLRRFYFDTVTHSGPALRYLVGLVGADRVVLGTDLPFDMADGTFKNQLAALDIEGHEMDLITGRNADRAFALGGTASGRVSRP